MKCYKILLLIFALFISFSATLSADDVTVHVELRWEDGWPTGDMSKKEHFVDLDLDIVKGDNTIKRHRNHHGFSGNWRENGIPEFYTKTFSDKSDYFEIWVHYQNKGSKADRTSYLEIKIKANNKIYTKKTAYISHKDRRKIYTVYARDIMTWAGNQNGNNDPGHKKDKEGAFSDYCLKFDVKAKSEKKIRLKWKHAYEKWNKFGSAEIRIYRRRADKKDYERIFRGHISSNDERWKRYNDKTCKPGKKYYYYLTFKHVSYNEAHKSPSLTATTDIPGPHTPNNFRAVPNDNQCISLYWDCKTDFLDGYKIYMKKKNQNDFRQIGNTSSNIKMYSAENLKADTAYEFKVAAYNRRGDAWSSSIMAKTFPKLDDNITGEMASKIYRALRLLYVSGVITDGGKVILNSGQEIIFENGFDSGNCFSLDAFILNFEPPTGGAPSKLAANSLDNSQIYIEWEDNTKNEDKFLIWRKTEGDNDFKKIAEVTRDKITFTDTKLKQNTEYAYKVQAFNTYVDPLMEVDLESGYTNDIIKTGTTGFSNIDNATTHYTKPSTPEKLQLKVINGVQIDLTWEDSYYETGYTLYKSYTRYNNVEIEEITLPKNTTSYSDKGLMPETTYFYMIQAYNPEHESEKSLEKWATTTDEVPPPQYTQLNCKLKLKKGHWIPNTCGILQIKEIQLTATQNNENISIPIHHNKIKILAPADPNWATNDAGQNNINRNKGTCEYRLYACGENKNYWLAEFSRDGVNGNQHFKITYNPEYFDKNGKIKDSRTNNLYVNNDGQLTFKNDISVLTEFGIKVMENTGTIRPGDDLLLKFTLADYETQITTPAKATDGDFMAVYDHKMLWRASLYINEGAFIDWNFKNPWDSPDNEWNKIYKGRGRCNSLNDLGNSDGGQGIEHFPYTYSVQYPGEEFDAIKDVVAYAYGCSDTPFEYNDEMYQQKVILDYFISTPDLDINQLPYTLINNHNRNYYNDYNDTHPDGWNQTLAPGNPVPYPMDNSWYTRYIYPNITIGKNENNVVNFVEINGENYFPYLPGWAVQRWWDKRSDDIDNGLPNNSSNWIPDDWENIISAGVDCIGLTQMSASYKNNPYRWDDIQENNTNSNRYGLSLQNINNSDFWYLDTDDNIANDRRFPRPDGNYSWMITYKDNLDDEMNVKNLNKVVPGDIVYFDKDNNGIQKHIMMVYKIEYNEDTRNTEPDKIILIEATFDTDSFAKVINERTLMHNEYKTKDWGIFRLQPNN